MNARSYYITQDFYNPTMNSPTTKMVECLSNKAAIRIRFDHAIDIMDGYEPTTYIEWLSHEIRRRTRHFL